ncbi:hypothetical protein RB601_004036 [Gaeumannomyces tritici]
MPLAPFCALSQHWLQNFSIMFPGEARQKSVPLTRATEDSDEEDHQWPPPAARDVPDIDKKQQQQHQQRCLRTSHLVSFALGVLLGPMILFVAGIPGYKTASSLPCSSDARSYSPILGGKSMSYFTVAFNGSFMKETIYRRPPAADVDEAWEKLGVDYRPSVIPESEALASGLGKHHVKRAKEYGGGYFVQVEGLHHLHCLNLVRKSLYFNQKYYKAVGDSAFGSDEQINRYHITHCLDTLRQVLMCNVDTGVLGQVWTLQPEATVVQAFPDFNTLHKCKDYEAVRKWGEEHQVAPNGQLPEGFIAEPKEGDVIRFIP